MTIVVVAALASWTGGPVLLVLGGLAAIRWPVPALLAATAWAVAHHRRTAARVRPDDEARLLDRLVAELDGGASPRAALVAVSRRSGPIDITPAARLAAAGLPARQIAISLVEQFPHNGRLIAAAWALAADVGAPAGPVMSLLARRAAERGRLDRERRAMTAQARATAWLIAGLPMAIALALALSGRIRTGHAVPIVLAGCGLQLMGLGVVWIMVRRAA